MTKRNNNTILEPQKSDKNDTLEQVQEFLTSNKNSDCIAIAGMKGTGKSQYITNEVHEEKKQIIFVSPKAAKPMRFSERYIICNFDDFCKISPEKLQNLAIIFDDCKYYIASNPNAQSTKRVIDILRMSRHNNNSIRLVFHSLNDVAPQIFANIDKLLLFKTVSEIDRFRGIVPEFEKINTAFIEVANQKNIHFCKIVDLR